MLGTANRPPGQALVEGNAEPLSDDEGEEEVKVDDLTAADEENIQYVRSV